MKTLIVVLLAWWGALISVAAVMVWMGRTQEKSASQRGEGTRRLKVDAPQHRAARQDEMAHQPRVTTSKNSLKS